MDKKKLEHQQNFLDLQTCIKDVAGISHTVNGPHSHAIGSFALILACLTEKAQLEIEARKAHSGFSLLPVDVGRGAGQSNRPIIASKLVS